MNMKTYKLFFLFSLLLLVVGFSAYHDYKLVHCNVSGGGVINLGEEMNLTYKDTTGDWSYKDTQPDGTACVVVCADSASELIGRYFQIGYTNENSTTAHHFVNGIPAVIQASKVNSSNCYIDSAEISEFYALFPGRVTFFLSNESTFPSTNKTTLFTDQYYLGWMNATRWGNETHELINLTSVWGTTNSDTNVTSNDTGHCYFVVSLLFYNGSEMNYTTGCQRSELSIGRTAFGPTQLWVNGLPITIFDLSGPIVNITHPEEDTYYSPEVDLNYTVWDNADPQPDTCWYSLDNGTTNITLPDCNNTTLTGLTPGSYCVIVFSNDSSGNIGNDSVCFNVSYSLTLHELYISPQSPFVDDNLSCYASANITTDNKTIHWRWYLNDSLFEEGNTTIYGSFNITLLSTINVSNTSIDDVWTCEAFLVFSSLNGTPRNDSVLIYDYWPKFKHDVQALSLAEGIEPSSNDTAWVYEINGTPYSPVVFGDYVYIAVDNQSTPKLFKFNRTSGTLIWSADLYNGSSAGILIHNSTIYVPTQQGVEAWLDSGTSASRLWSFNTSISSQGIAWFNQYIIFTSNDTLFMLDANTGSQVWNYTNNTKIVGMPIIYRGRIYFSEEHGVRAVDTADGSFLWNFTLSSEVVRSSPLAVNERVVFCAGNTSFALNYSTGVNLSSFEFDENITQSPVSFDSPHLLFVGKSRIYHYDGTTDSIDWTYNTSWNSLERGSPSVIGSLAVIPFQEGILAINDSGTHWWNWTSSLGVNTSSAIYDSYVYLGSGSRIVTLFRMPRVEHIYIDPSVPVPEDNLLCYVNLSASTNDNVSVFWRWYRNGEENLSGSGEAVPGEYTLISNLSYENTSEGEVWICEVYPITPSVNGTPNYDSVYIHNHWPMDKQDTGGGSDNPEIGPRTNHTSWNFTAENITGAIVFDGVYVIHGENITKLNRYTGEQDWSVRLFHNASRMPLYYDGKLFAGTKDGYLFAYSSSGSHLWNKSLCTESIGSLNIYANEIIFTCGDLVMAANVSNGEHLWNYSLQYNTSATPAIYKGRLFVVAGNTTLSLDPKNGNQYWAAEFENFTNSSPAVGGDLVFIGVNGSIRAYNYWTGDLSWAAPTPSQGSSNPFVAYSDEYEKVYFGTNGTLVVLNASDGAVNNSFVYDSPNPISSMAIGSEMVYISTGDKLMGYYLNGTKVWEYSSLSGEETQIILSDSWVFGGNETVLFAFFELPEVERVYVDMAGLVKNTGRIECYANLTHPTEANLTAHWRILLNTTEIASGSTNVSSGILSLIANTTIESGDWQDVSCVITPGTSLFNGSAKKGWMLHSEQWPVYKHSPFFDSSTTENAPRRGLLRWTFNSTGNVSDIIIYNNTVYFTVSENRTLYAIYLENGSVKWSFEFGEGNKTLGSPIYYSGYVLIGTNESRLYAFNDSGQPEWNISLLGNSTKAINFYDGFAIVATDRNIQMINISSGNILWNSTDLGEIETAPLIYAASVYVGTDENLTALDITDGSVRWVRNLSCNVTTPIGIENILYLGCDNKQVYAINSTWGDIIWNRTLDYKITGSVAYGSRDYLYVPAEKELYLLNVSNNGSILSNYSTGGNIYGSPAVDAVVEFASSDGRIYGLNASNVSQLLWNYSTNDTFNHSGAIVDKWFVIGSVNGTIYAFSDVPQYNITVIIDGVNTTNFTYYVGHPYNVTVVVADSSGNPQEDTIVRIIERDGHNVYASWQPTIVMSTGYGEGTTNADGRVEFGLIPTGFQGSVQSSYNLSVQILDNYGDVALEIPLNLVNDNLGSPNESITKLGALRKNEVSNMLTKLSLVINKAMQFQNNGKAERETLNTSNGGEINISTTIMKVNVPYSFEIKGDPGQTIIFKEKEGNLLFAAPQTGMVSMSLGRVMLNSSGEGVITIIPTAYGAPGDYLLSIDVYSASGDLVNTTNITVDTSSTTDYYDTGEDILNGNDIGNTLTNADIVVSYARLWINY